MRYNTDMNDVIFVEEAVSHYATEAGRYLEIIVPVSANGKESGPAGKIKYGNTEITFGSDEILIVPPRTERELYINDKNALRLLIDNSLLPATGITTVFDLPQKNIRTAAEQALFFFRTGYKKRGAVLSALGALIISLVTLNAGERERISPVTEKIRADIEKHISDSAFSLDAYLNGLPLSYDYVRRLFKKDTGLTPHDYLKNVRLERAAQILRSGQTNRYSFYTVAQIADLCGYSDSMYFSKAFKKHFGVAPTDYGKK